MNETNKSIEIAALNIVIANSYVALNEVFTLENIKQLDFTLDEAFYYITMMCNNNYVKEIKDGVFSKAISTDEMISLGFRIEGNYRNLEAHQIESIAEDFNYADMMFVYIIIRAGIIADKKLRVLVNDYENRVSEELLKSSLIKKIGDYYVANINIWDCVDVLKEICPDKAKMASTISSGKRDDLLGKCLNRIDNVKNAIKVVNDYFGKIKLLPDGTSVPFNITSGNK